jgi:hypothetical protein
VNFNKVSSILLTTFLIGSSLLCTAQNKGSVYSHTESHNERFTAIVVDLQHFAELQITTSAEKGFYITDEKQSGEYKDALVLNTQVRNDTLIITDPLNPAFEFPQDKLSAHKITDTRAQLVLPEHTSLFLNLVNSNLHIAGNFKDVVLNIHSGRAYFKQMSGNINVVSVDAAISASGLKNYSFKASSRNGSVTIRGVTSNSAYLMQVESIYGDITLN